MSHRLTKHYKGHDLEAELLGDGTVVFQGESFETCSSAAEAARGTITGRKMNTNGWTFWQYPNADGKLVCLDEARREFQLRASPLSSLDSPPQQTSCNMNLSPRSGRSVVARLCCG